MSVYILFLYFSLIFIAILAQIKTIFNLIMLNQLVIKLLYTIITEFQVTKLIIKWQKEGLFHSSSSVWVKYTY